MKTSLAVLGTLVIALAASPPAHSQETVPLDPADSLPPLEPGTSILPPAEEIPLSEDGFSDTPDTDEGFVIDGDYIIAGDGAGDIAVLGRISFDGTGIVGGALTFVGDGGDASPEEPGDSPDDSVAPAAEFETVRCNIVGGIVALEPEGTGPADVQLVCGDADVTVTWELFITEAEFDGRVTGLRAVQPDRVPFAGASDVIDLNLTLSD